MLVFGFRRSQRKQIGRHKGGITKLYADDEVDNSGNSYSYNIQKDLYLQSRVIGVAVVPSGAIRLHPAAYRKLPLRGFCRMRPFSAPLERMDDPSVSISPREPEFDMVCH
jgi:hypothetical protein